MDLHINDARKIMARPQPFSIKFLTTDSRIIHVESAVSLKEDLRSGTRTIKCIPSNQIRRVRDAFILELNDNKVFI